VPGLRHNDVAGTAPRLVVPAYFRPDLTPGAWEWLAARAPIVRSVILNPSSGPGHEPDPCYHTALDALRAAGVIVTGYVDTNYGGRAASAALAEVERYQRWYHVAGVCFDRVAADPAQVGHYAALAAGARLLGARLVIFNHGVHPAEQYADHADVLGTFEGPWRSYLRAAVPRWTRSRPAEQFYHVVHAVPPRRLGDAMALAARRQAGCAYITDRSGPNPYDGLPSGFADQDLPQPASQHPTC
jgi:Spherulation-specific family 4